MHCYSDFGHAGPCTTFCHRCFQMFSLITLHCKRAMNGLNPYTLPYENTEHNTKHMEEIVHQVKVKSGITKKSDQQINDWVRFRMEDAINACNQKTK